MQSELRICGMDDFVSSLDKCFLYLWHRHILNVARPLRFQAGLLTKLWGECALTTVYLINHTPTPLLEGKTRVQCLITIFVFLDV